MPARSRCTTLLLLALAAAAAPARLAAADGELDPGFGGDGSSFVNLALDADSRDLVRALAVQGDGRFVVAGWTSDDDGEETKAVVVRVDPDGSLDTSFDGDGAFALDLSALGLSTYRRGMARGVAIDAAGRIVVVGELSDAADDRHALIFRLTPGGALDPSFSGDGVAIGAARGAAYDVDIDRSTGVIWVLGDSSPNRIWTWRWDDGASVERDWFIPDALEQEGRAIVVQPDGKPLLGGHYYVAGGYDWEVYVARLLADGSTADSSFGGGGLATYGFDLSPPDYDDDFLLDIGLDTRGRVVVLAEAELGAGDFDSASDLGFLRLTAAGALDPTFAGDGSAVVSFLPGTARDAWYEGELALQGDGRIVAGMTPGATPFEIRAGALRLLENGDRDLPFGGAGTGQITVNLEPLGGPGEERCGFAAIGLEGGRVVGSGASEWDDPDLDFGFARLTNAYIFVDGLEIGSAFFWSATSP
jgi:uncharacterized delta-60 repeat protein